MAVTPVGTPVMTRATSGSVTGTWGTGQNRTAGNVLWALVSAGGSTASAAAISTPSGWAQVATIGNTATTANAWVAIYRKTAAGSDSAPAFTATLTGTAAMTVTLLELSGCLNAGPVQAYGVYQSGGSSGTLSAMTAGTGLPAVGGAYAAGIFCQEAAAAANTWNPGGGWSNLASDGATSSVLHTAVDYQVPATSSATAETANWTTDSSAFGAGIVVVICPPAGLESYAADVPSTTVSSGGTTAPAAGTVETWTVASSTGFPAASNGTLPPVRYHVADPAQPSEDIEVIQQVSSTSWLVVRGADGTTPVAHAGGFTVYQVVNAGTFGDIPQVYNVRSRRFGAAGDGATDDYAAIQLALSTCAANGGGTVYFPPGTYLTSNIPQIGSYTTLQGPGKGLATLRMKSGSWSSVAQVGGINGIAALMTAGNAAASYIAVRDLTIDGNQTGITALPSWATGGTAAGDNVTNSPLHLNNVTGLCIERVEVINSIGYAVYPQLCSQLTIKDCRVVTGQVSASQGWGLPSQQDCIHLDGCTQWDIGGNYLDSGTSTTNVGDDTIALQSLSGPVTDGTIRGNRMRSCEAGVDLALSGYAIANITVTENDFWWIYNNGVTIQPFAGSSVLATNISITGNTFNTVCVSGGSVAAVSLQDYSRFTTAAIAWDGVTVTGNTFENITSSNAATNVIYAGWGTGLTVTGNEIRACNVPYAVQLGGNNGTSLPCTGYTVSGNLVDMTACTAGGCIGIVPLDSPKGTVTGNTVLGPGPNASGQVGINPVSIGAVTQFLTVTGNTVAGWDNGIQEANAGGGNPDNNTYGLNTFTNCTVTLSLLGPHNVAQQAAGTVGGVLDTEQLITLTSTYTLTSQTAAQKLFNATANGALTVPAATAFFFECFFTLSSMSSSSGGFGFALGGTATLTAQLWESEGNKAALATAAAPQATANTAANTAIVTATANTVGWARITGKIRVNAAGTLIPQVSLGVAAAAVVGADSWFRIWPAGPAAVTSIGNWG